MSGCYYRRLGTDGDYMLLEPTASTGSNWNRAIQHGSPPLAVLTKSIEGLAAGSGQRIARMSLDILGAIPVAPVRVRAWADRPGRRIAVYMAEMVAAGPDGGARAVARVTAWLLATSDTSDVARDRYPPLVEQAPAEVPSVFANVPGYLETVAWRPQHTALGEASVFWMTPKATVFDGEPDSPLVKLAAVVDAANGVGATLDHTKFTYMNTDTVVHLHRLPVGADFALRARASIGPDGVGVTTTEVFDRQGFIGTCAQTLLVRRR